MTGRPKVVYWNNQPTPYVVARFNAVARRGHLDFEAWFDGLRESDRSWHIDPSTWEFPARVIPRRSLLGGRWQVQLPLPLAELRAVRPDLLVCNYDQRNMVLGAIAARTVAGRVTLRCLPTFDAWVQPDPIRDLVRRMVFRLADGAKVPGPDGRAYARRHGLPPYRTWPVTQSIDVEHYARARRMDPTERATRRAELGLAGCVFVYVGRIWSGKGLDTLVTAYRQVRAANPDVRLLLVGDGPDEARLRTLTESLPDVVWAGFVQPADLPDIYALADVLVFPTLGDPNGLVVEEAMAAGLPVISTSAAGDIRARVPEGVAGHVVPPAEPEPLAARMVDLAAAPRRRAEMGDAAARIAARFVAEAYAKDFERFVDGVLAMPRRGGLLATAAGLGSRLLLATARDQPPVTPVTGPLTKTG